jgi:osmoprotectant transport system substrate-binding protein
MVYATDGGIAAAKLVVLEDDRHDQPIYAPVPLIRADVLRARPEIAALVKPVMASLSRDTLQNLNERVQVDGESIQSVARDYLERKGLLK